MENSSEIKCKKCGIKLVSAQFGLLCKNCISSNKNKFTNNKPGSFQKPMKSLRRSGRSK